MTDVSKLNMQTILVGGGGMTFSGAGGVACVGGGDVVANPGRLVTNNSAIIKNAGAGWDITCGMTTRISYTGSYGASINATRYEIAGTTVIDSSRNASFASVASAGNVTGVDLSITGWVYIGGVPVLKGRGAAVSAPSGGSTVDTECRNQLSALLAQLRAVGVIAA